MDIIVVGAGKLATALLSKNTKLGNSGLIKWDDFNPETDKKAILIHAGSGRQLDEAMEYCSKSNSVFIELSTGLKTEELIPDFPLIICPNTSILLLKAMKLLSLSGKYFSNEKISIIESHQATKTSVPGTAYQIAESLNVDTNVIQSVRDRHIQSEQIGIPEEFLNRHAYHRIIIGEGNEQVTIEMKVLGHDAYVSGVEKIVHAVLKNTFDKKRYSVLDLIEENLI